MASPYVALVMSCWLLATCGCMALRHEAEEVSNVREASDKHDRFLPRAGTTISEDEWQHPRLIYGIHTSNDEKRYGVKLQAQFNTWAKDIPRERMLVVGPTCENPKLACLNAENRIWDTSECLDANKVCKVMTYMQRAYARMATLDFDWLFGLNEDQYIVEHLMAKALKQYNSSRPLVLTGFGCSRKWKYDPRSKNGTLPKPVSYTENQEDGQCPFIDHHGSICGGTGIAYSRAAVARLVEHNNWTDFANSISNVDPAMTCLLADAGVEIQTLPWTVGMQCPPYGPYPNAAAYHIAIPDGRLWQGQPVAEYMEKLHKNIQAVPLNQSYEPPPFEDTSQWGMGC